MDCIVWHTHTGKGMWKNTRKWIAYLGISIQERVCGKIPKMDCIHFEFWVGAVSKIQAYTKKYAENTYFHTEHTCFEVSHLLTFSRYEGDASIPFEIEGKQDPYRKV